MGTFEDQLRIGMKGSSHLKVVHVYEIVFLSHFELIFRRTSNDDLRIRLLRDTRCFVLSRYNRSRFAVRLGLFLGRLGQGGLLWGCVARLALDWFQRME